LATIEFQEKALEKEIEELAVKESPPKDIKIQY